MEDIPYIYRLRALVIVGAKVGVQTAFWSSLIYVLVISGYIAILAIFDKMLILSFLVVGFWMFIIGVIPATIIGAVGGALIAAILAFWKQSIPNIFACLIGLIVSAPLVLFANYWFWLDAISPYPYSHTPFLEFLLPINIYSFSVFIFSVNWFFIPSSIAILLSPFVGWKINNSSIPYLKLLLTLLQKE